MKWCNLMTPEELAEIRRDPVAAAYLDAAMAAANSPNDVAAQEAHRNATERLTSSLQQRAAAQLPAPVVDRLASGSGPSTGELCPQ